jgi:acetylornithine deacetylase/succinyl-diaminopimelate desuccinylase-like protein
MKVDIDAKDVGRYAEESRAAFERDLKKLVDLPSVSMDPAHKKDIEATAAEAARLLTEFGAKAEVVKTKGNPVVIGEFSSGNAANPTVTVYNHLDVQPADASEWKSPPFDMKIDNGTYFGRGSTDDKGPALTVLYAARYAHQHKIPVNIKFIWELEEEIGSPNFEQFLLDNKDKLKTNSVVVSDTIWVSRERPAIGYGLRGLQGVILKLDTGVKDVHSGLVGGLARNPIGELAKLISEAYDATTGEIKIPGFYDDVRKLDDAEMKNFVRFLRGRIQTRARAEVAKDERQRRRRQAHLGDADLRSAWYRGWLQRARRQDDRAAPCRSENQHAPGAGSGSGEGIQTAVRFREIQKSRCRDRA